MRPDPTAGQEVELLFGQTLSDAAGRPFELASLRGRPLVVNFWATWCAPCVEEMPELSALHTEVSPRGIHVVGIGIDSPANIAQFAQKLPVSYPLLVAGLQGTELARRFGNSAGALPYTVLVDAQGRVVFRKLGRIRLDQLRAHALAMAR